MLARMDRSKPSTRTDSSGPAEPEGTVLAPRTWCPACVQAGTRLGQRDLGWRDLEARARREELERWNRFTANPWGIV
jgi:hypothetical protein